MTKKKTTLDFNEMKKRGKRLLGLQPMTFQPHSLLKKLKWI